MAKHYQNLSDVSSLKVQTFVFSNVFIYKENK